MSKYPVDPDWSDDDPRWSRPSIYDGAEDEDVPAGPVGSRSVWAVPLPQADRRDLLDVRPWQTAEAALAAELARAAQAVGRLDEAVRSRGDAAVQRLAYREVEAMSRAEGLWLDRDRIGRSVLEAGGDLERARDLARARWALRRLWAAPGVETDLRRFLGLHDMERRQDDARPDPDLPDLRPAGEAFDAAAADWQGALDRLGPVHPFTAALYGMRLWRLAGISAADDVIEAATYAARSAARENRALPFLCLAPRGLSWGRGGPARDHLALWLDEIRDGALTSLAELDRIGLWQQQATARTTDLGGRAPGRLIAALAARPYATTVDLAEAAAVSRDTAERLLPKLQDRGLVREVTGRGRYRLWAAGCQSALNRAP